MYNYIYTKPIVKAGMTSCKLKTMLLQTACVNRSRIQGGWKDAQFTLAQGTQWIVTMYQDHPTHVWMKPAPTLPTEPRSTQPRKNVVRLLTAVSGRL